jgi:aminomethyltransferase
VAQLKPLTPMQLATSLKIAATDPATFEGKKPEDIEKQFEQMENAARGLASLLEQPTDNFQIGVAEAMLITAEDNPWTVGMGRFVHLDRAAKFVGREALQRIQAEGPQRQLVGVEIAGDALDFNDALWPVRHQGADVGHLSRCCYSPRLKRNIGWVNVPSELAGVGMTLTLVTPDGVRTATVCETPWFKSFVAIPEELKTEIRSGAKNPQEE